MSNAVTALNGAAWSDGIATIAEAPMQGMITLRGDLNAAAVQKAATEASGVAMPTAGQATVTETGGLCWMSPDELLVLCPYADVATVLERMTQTLGTIHALAVDVSDARASFLVSGPHAREVMAKLAPVDLAPDRFTAGMFRRTRMAQVPAAFWLRDAETFQIVCFRSHATYMFDLLKTAATPGSTVAAF